MEILRGDRLMIVRDADMRPAPHPRLTHNIITEYRTMDETREPKLYRVLCATSYGHDALTSLGWTVRSNRAHELVSVLLKAGIGIDWGESAVAIE